MILLLIVLIINRKTNEISLYIDSTLRIKLILKTDTLLLQNIFNIKKNEWDKLFFWDFSPKEETF